MAAPDLTGRDIADTYKDLLQVSNSNAGIDTTLRVLSDGEGTSSKLLLSTAAIKCETTPLLPTGDASKITAGRTGVLIPYYIYPNSPYTDATVARLLGIIRQYRDVPVIVVINPESGPGTVWDGNYAAFIKVLQAAGATVCGYVSTTYAGTITPFRTEAQVKADIDQWLTLYAATPIDGLFLDEMTYAATDSNIALYTEYTDYAHSRNLYPVIGNPGTNPLGAYFSTRTSDIIVVNESGTWPTETNMLGNYVDGHVDYRYTLRAALVYGQTTLNPGLVRQLAKYVQWIYVTADTLSPNPWDSLSGYLEQLFSFLSAPALPGPAGKIGGAIGDSITAFFLGYNSTSKSTSTSSYVAWLRVLSRQAVDIPTDNLWATAGHTTTQMVADGFHTSAAAAGLDFCLVLGGTNDLPAIDTATTIANLTTIYDTVLASGALVVAVAVLPRNTAGITAAMHQKLWAINAWIRAKAASDNRIIMVDCGARLVDAAGTASTTMFYDGLHPHALGAYTIGKAIWDNISHLVPPVERRIIAPEDVYNATYHTRGNQLTNGLLTGTGGGAGSGDITGDIAASWTMARQNSNLNTCTCVCSKVTRTDGEGGVWQQFEISGTTTAIVSYQFRQTSYVLFSGATYNEGDVLEGYAEFEIDAGSSGLVGVTFIQLDDDTGTTTYVSRDMVYIAPSGVGSPYPAVAVSGILRIPRHTVITGSDRFRPYFDLTFALGAVSATIRIGKVSLRKVIAY